MIKNTRQPKLKKSLMFPLLVPSKASPKMHFSNANPIGYLINVTIGLIIVMGVVSILWKVFF
ncbi:hypothetical protein [Lentilactobacillus kisonensis]|uniref:Uncharacterized protein n=1 Tax=Lentilactobacillus kisonensis DSM 19906 = JCM 15041 TaxID=1423766 RepID=A0A0R1NGB9_9LACO|nr:hypothetical protein [Lentilactobacillus kisonensis]KRL19373.1 hypothetical protein FC98_GL002122 [Lentilactobacillus kisonensis DSM 19906 = JCM 15041]